jgi:hypothetical protein
VVQALIVNLVAIAIPIVAQPPPEAVEAVPVQIMRIENASLSIPDNTKWTVDFVKAKDGVRIRVTVEEVILEAKQLQIKVADKPGEPVQITGIEGAAITVKAKTTIRFEPVKTPKGSRIRFSIDKIALEVTKAEVEQNDQSNRSIAIFRLDKDGLLSVDRQTLP